MTLDQRVEALEMAIANMAVQQSNAEGISEIARKVTAEVNTNARLPGGVLNAAQKEAAIDSNVNAIIDNSIENLLSNTRQFQR